VLTTPINSLCKKHIADCGLTLPEIKNEDRFRLAELPAEFMKTLAKKPLKFDAVIVDEVQDFPGAELMANG
jgi:hypothetical protein